MASAAFREQVLRAPESVVKQLLLALCEDKDVEKIALARLNAMPKSSGASQGSGRKRKATDDLAICVQCESPFYKDDNRPKDCLYHPGESEVDWDSSAWVDHDENCHGEIDSDSMRKEHPEGFIWSCCDKTGEESAGCTRGYHESDPNKAWKEGSEVDSDEEDSEDSEDWE
ncbi:unnamed protein product [Clonostachys solani]|uniref:Uncharacterized protein n=1 Tax=Clonostachys solani TaxID=160281 RepID=A0A9N9ZHZ9_9HYPO|nr:unnamed protein product [Clonostachys solani]